MLNNLQATKRAYGKKSQKLSFDRYGRMSYHPEFHGRHLMPWTTSEQRYLIENYEKDGPEAVSLALERSIKGLMSRVSKLRAKGLMPKTTPRRHHKRLMNKE